MREVTSHESRITLPSLLSDVITTCVRTASQIRHRLFNRLRAFTGLQTVGDFVELGREVLAHRLAHFFHGAGHGLGIVLIHIAEHRRIGHFVQPLILALGNAHAIDQALKVFAAADWAGDLLHAILGVTLPDADSVLAGLTKVFVDRHSYYSP